jgi:ATP-binding cassette subfamily F protein 3
MIRIENLSKSFGDRVLFEQANFRINPRERIGLVGRNGQGKTTLMRMICGDVSSDSGAIIIPKNYRIAHVRQKLEFSADTVLKEGATGLLEQDKDQLWKIEKILAGLGFSSRDMHRHPDEFSGGYQVRLNLAKHLVSEPDLLLLDEPTNYLDITSIRWIERFLLAWPHEVLLITHDRSFMDKIVTHTMGIHRRNLRKIEGATEKYYNQLAQDEEVHEKTRINDERRRKEIELFISRFRAKARLANLVQSRIKTLEKMDRHQKLEKIESLGFSFRSKPFPAKQVMRVSDMRFGYESDKPLISEFNLNVANRDRICVVGKNGKGKTTLIKLLAGELNPQSGYIRYNPNVSVGLFEQSNVKTLVDERTVEEEIAYSNPQLDRQATRNICGAMMFSGDDALKKVSVLSGGEKSRVILGKLLVTPANLLLLDEPTNHLDMEACDALLAAIDSFDGTVIMVTHNELFLHALARRLIVFQENRIDIFEGSYARFLETEGWSDELTAAEKPAHEQTAGSRDEKPNRKEIRRRRSAIIAERSRILNPIERRINTIENDIEKCEERLLSLNQEMQAATLNQDGDRIADISRDIHACQSAIDDLFNDLEAAAADQEEQKALFDARLEQFESELK